MTSDPSPVVQNDGNVLKTVSVSITAPSNGAIVKGSTSGVTFLVRGLLSSYTGNGIKDVEVRTDAIPYATANPVSQGNWSQWSIPISVRQPGNMQLVAKVTDDAGNKKWYTISVNVVLADQFGILTKYPTLLNGRTWYSNWNTPAHAISSGDFDPYDHQFQARGDGYAQVKGDGTLSLSGSAPRVYVYDPSLANKWKNVEITFYAKRVSAEYYASYQGITAGARSGTHDDVKYPNVCIDNTGYPDGAYNGRLTYDGRADYVKEVLYHRADAISGDDSGKSPLIKAAFPNANTPIDSKTRFHTMPQNTWIGYKFVVMNSNNDTSVKLETWIDLTDGANGGTWTKINEFTDSGGWAATYFYATNSKTKWPCPTVKPDNVITSAMPYVFIRADNVKEIDYKKFSIREINSPS